MKLLLYFYFLLPCAFALIEIDTLTMSMKFCCDCRDFNLNCPVCTYNNKYYCEKPYYGFSQSAQNFFSNHFSKLRLKYLYQAVTHKMKYCSEKPFVIYPRNDNVFATTPIQRSSVCAQRQVNSLYSSYYTAKSCTLVTGTNDECPRATIPGLYGCDWSEVRELVVDNAKFCYAPYWDNMNTPFFSKSDDGLCPLNLVDFKAPKVLEYAKARNTLPTLPYKFLGRSRDTYLFETYDNTMMEKLLRKFSSFPLCDQTIGSDIDQRSLCKGPVHDDPLVYNGAPSWLGEILIMPPCSEYYPYDETRHICDSALFSTLSYCPTETFINKPTPYETFELEYEVIDTNNPFFNVTCSKIDRFGNCLLHHTLETFVANLSSIAQNFTNEFIDALGRNDSNVYYYNQYGSPQGLVGNWFSGIFGSLIEPFFDAFINMVLKIILPPLFESVINIIKELSALLSELSSQILKFITQLADALTNLLNILLKLLIGLISVLESHILLFEYTVVFLLILWRVVDDPVFAATLTFMLILIFGLERKSPSLILYFLNQEFQIFNLSDYYQKEFDFSYSLSYTDDVSSKVFYFSNSTVVSIPF